MLMSEIKVGNAWQVVSIDDALVLRCELMRCIACHGRVIPNPNREFSYGAEPHFSHLLSFAYCSGDGAVASPLHPHPVS
jgi:hypothetical protein